MTFYDKNNEFTEQKQNWGEIVAVNENTVHIKKMNGEEFSIPNDLSAIEPAEPGEYKLRSTGEVVKNPDYLSTWIITRPD